MVIDFLIFTSRPSARQWSLISFYLYQDPLRGNGHWFPHVHIKVLYDVMVIDFLMFTSRLYAKQWSWFFSSSRPSTRQWSSISLHQDPLRGNGHWFLYINTLCETLVIDFLTSKPYTRQWSLIFLSHRDPLWCNGHQFIYIKTLYEALVIDFFTPRTSTMQWSSISLHQGPLWGNGHWFSSFRYRPSPRDWSNMFFQKVRKENNKTKWFCQIVTIYMVMVTKSFGYRPSPRDWFNLFSKSQKKKNFGSEPSTW